jgi:hypothetical protein
LIGIHTPIRERSQSLCARWVFDHAMWMDMEHRREDEPDVPSVDPVAAAVNPPFVDVVTGVITVRGLCALQHQLLPTRLVRGQPMSVFEV